MPGMFRRLHAIAIAEKARKETEELLPNLSQKELVDYINETNNKRMKISKIEQISYFCLGGMIGLGAGTYLTSDSPEIPLTIACSGSLATAVFLGNYMLPKKMDITGRYRALQKYLKNSSKEPTRANYT